MESSFQEIAVESDLHEVDLLANNWKKSDSKIVAGSDCASSPGFDCNICLDFVQDPVVTHCGHLFCWPCIYKWLSLRNNSIEHSSDHPEPQCPVCKSLISESTLVPLYGRGKTLKTSEEKSSNLDLVIPRPPAPVSWHLIPSSLSQHPAQPPVQHNYHFNQPPQELHHHNLLHQPQPYYLHSNHYAPSPSSRFSGYNYNMPTNNIHPVVGMFGGMVYERMFGNSMPSSYNYQHINNPYVSHSSSRLRRQVMQAEKSLTRICFFLFCCTILCLILF